MTFFVISIAALALGPIAYHLADRARSMLTVLDGFIFVTIGGLITLSILPESIRTGGWLSVAFVLAGFAGPTVAENVFRGTAKRTHVAALVLGLVGFALHALLDGVALGEGDAAASVRSGSLAVAVVVHRFPVGLTIWWLLRPPFGARVATLALGSVVGATALGFFLGTPILAAGVSTAAIAWFQAFMAGSLMHVVFHRPHLDGHSHTSTPKAPSVNRLEGAGAVLALALLGVVLAASFQEGPSVLSNEIGPAFLGLVFESAPALLIAYGAAGLLSVFMPTSSVAWMARGPAAVQAARGMAFGLPLPICSCGVVPLYRTLVKRGAPPAAAMAFLVATPELGVDAIFLSFPLLGLHMTLVRVAGAAAVALTVGWLVGRSTKALEPDAVPPDAGPAAESTLGARIRRGLRVGFGNVVDDTAPWILAGLAVAAISAPFLDSAPLAALPGGVDVLLFAVLGVPTYVCASAATPLVAALLVGGLSPGAALAFLITGPATNVTTFGVLSQLHGRRTAGAFSLAIIGSSVGLGYLVNVFFADIQHVALDTLLAETPSVVKIVAAVGLGLVFIASLLRRGPRGFLAELSIRGG